LTFIALRFKVLAKKPEEVVETKDICNSCWEPYWYFDQ